MPTWIVVALFPPCPLLYTNLHWKVIVHVLDGCICLFAPFPVSHSNVGKNLLLGDIWLILISWSISIHTPTSMHRIATMLLMAKRSPIIPNFDILRIVLPSLSRCNRMTGFVIGLSISFLYWYSVRMYGKAPRSRGRSCAQQICIVKFIFISRVSDNIA